MVPSIADRIITAIADGCDLKDLRRGLSDIAAQPLDYAITGLLEAGTITILDGYIALKRLMPPDRPAARKPPPLSHPWKQLLAVQKAGR